MGLSLTPAETYFQQNAIAGTWTRWLTARGLTLETIAEAQLGAVNEPLPGDGKFIGALSIPYFDGRGRYVGMRFRHQDGATWPSGTPKPKYDQHKHNQGRLYGVHLIQKAEVVICEGEIDALILRQLGYASIGVHGATSFKDEWGLLFRDCEIVSVAFDGDDAGKKGARRVTRAIGRWGPRVRSVDLPEGQDINDLFLSNPGELKDLLS